MFVTFKFIDVYRLLKGVDYLYNFIQTVSLYTLQILFIQHNKLKFLSFYNKNLIHF